MKKLLLIFSFTVLSLFAKGQTWVYHPFPETNAIWNFEINISCPAIFTLYENYSITITGDTLINGQTYHKLFTPFVEQSYPGTTCGVMYPGYKGAIRQDTSLKKVFIIAYDTIEELLYDFTMQVGDTIKGRTGSLTDTVQSIDSILVGSSYRKRWNISPTNYISYIEGIGSTYGLIHQSPGNLIGTFPYYTLTCFSKDGITLLPSTSSCQLITSINSYDKISNHINIFPNPSNGSFTIETGDIEIKALYLSNLLGKKIHCENEVNQSVINIENLQSGTYILTIIDKENNSTNKKIVICEQK